MADIVPTQPEVVLAAIRDRLVAQGVVPWGCLVDADGDEPSALPGDNYCTVAVADFAQPDEHLQTFEEDLTADPFIAEGEVLVSLWLRLMIDTDGRSDASAPVALGRLRGAFKALHNWEPPDPDADPDADPPPVIVLQPLVVRGWKYGGPGRRHERWRRWTLRVAVQFEWLFREEE